MRMCKISNYKYYFSSPEFRLATDMGSPKFLTVYIAYFARHWAWPICFNVFVQQEPGANGTEIMNCLKHVRPGSGFEPNFELTKKIDVNGPSEHPLYSFLKVIRRSLVWKLQNCLKLIKGIRCCSAVDGATVLCTRWTELFCTCRWWMTRWCTHGTECHSNWCVASVRIDISVIQKSNNFMTL